MRILLTGGAGFIGSNVADGLVAAGHDVLVVDNLATGERENVNPRAGFREIDLRDPAIDNVFEDFRPEVVNHHAAQASVPVSVSDPVGDASINVLGTINLLRLSVKHQVRKFIFISTGGAIYGDPPVVPCDEDAPQRPLSPYGAAKAAAEVYVGTFGRTFGLDYTVLRYGNVYGPRMHFKAQEGLVVAIFVTRMLRGDPATVDGSGEQTRDFVFVGDCANANLAALERGSGGVFNVGTGHETSVNEIFRRTAALTGYERPPLRGPAREGDVFRIALDTSSAKEHLGWTATTSLDDGLRSTVEYFRPRV
jgi:UDP-glucose 4-epimerase